MPPNAFSNLFTPENLNPIFAFKGQIFVFLHFLAPYSTVFSLLLITGIVYCFIRIDQLVRATKHEDDTHGHGESHGDGSHSASEETPTQKRWARVQAHLNSEHESDWRLAVLEADVLLDELVTQMGYHGDSLGEKLRGVEKSDFLTLDSAWDAHAVRNKIAHQGSAFALTDREAKRVLKLYEEVFKEFHFI